MYTGKNADKAETDQIAAKIEELYPDVDYGIVDGDQPHYQYILSVE